MEETRQLLKGLLDRDPLSWKKAVREYSPLLLSLARKTFFRYGFDASGHDCEDVVAEVWRSLLADDLKLVRKCTDRGNLLPTLHVLVRNRAVDMMRSRGAEKRRLETYGLLSEEAASRGSALSRMTIKNCMNALNDRERTLINLFFLQGRSYSEISTLTGISMNSIGPTIKRALNKMKSLFDSG